MVSYQKIPYGISSYKTIRTQHRYYIDKTRYLPLLEHAGDFLFLIRPRRFGKSSWLMVLESYYDLARQEEWELLFKGTFIDDHPIPEKHAYLILKFNFSQVDPYPEHVNASFLEHTDTCFFHFGERCRAFLGDEYFTHIAQKTSTHCKLEVLLQYLSLQGHNACVLIDEYDNFANRILTIEEHPLYA